MANTIHIRLEHGGRSIGETEVWAALESLIEQNAIDGYYTEARGGKIVTSGDVASMGQAEHLIVGLGYLIYDCLEAIGRMQRANGVFTGSALEQRGWDKLAALGFTSPSTPFAPNQELKRGE